MALDHSKMMQVKLDYSRIMMQEKYFYVETSALPRLKTGKSHKLFILTESNNKLFQSLVNFVDLLNLNCFATI